MNEAGVRMILKRWSEKGGFRVIENVRANIGNRVDLLAQKGNEKWIVEVKGDYDSRAEQYNVNFDTGMGQLLKSITEINDQTRYAICIPFSKTERGEKLSFRLILKKYANSVVFELLNIHIILVRDDETVEVIDPKKVASFLHSISPKIILG